MEINILTLPIQVSVALVLWTIALLIYRVIQALIDRKKTNWKHVLKRKIQVGPYEDHSGQKKTLTATPCDDAASPDSVHQTGEYFLKSCEPCSSVGAISYPLAHTSNSDGIWMSSAGYSQFEDTFHVKLTGLETTQITGDEASGTKPLQTALDVEDSPRSTRSISTTPKRNTANSSCRSLASPEYKYKYLQNDACFDEALPGSDVFEDNKIHQSDGFQISIRNHFTSTSHVLDPPTEFGPSISVISSKLPGFPCDAFGSPKDGQLNKPLTGFAIPSLTNPSKIVTKKEKTPPPVLASVAQNSWLSELKSILDRKLTVGKFRKNANSNTDSMILIPATANSSPPLELPRVQPPISDNNIIIPPEADRECPQYDANHLEGLVDHTNSEVGNANLINDKQSMDDSEWITARVGAFPLLNLPPYITPRMKKSPIAYSNSFASGYGNFENPPCSINDNEKLPSFDIGKNKTSNTEDNLTQIQDQRTVDHFIIDVLGNTSPAISVEPSIECATSGNNEAVFSDGHIGQTKGVHEGLTMLGEQLHRKLPWIHVSQKKQSLATEQLQILIPDENGFTGFSEATLIPAVRPNFHDGSGTALKPEYLGCARRTSEDNLQEEIHILEAPDITSYCDAVTPNRMTSRDNLKDEENYSEGLGTTSHFDVVTLEASLNRMTFIPGGESPMRLQSSLDQNTMNSLGGTMTRNMCDFISRDNQHACSGLVKLQELSVASKRVGWEGKASPSESTADDPNSIQEDGFDICGIEEIQSFSPDQEGINSDAEVIRSAIISRRRSSTSSSSISILAFRLHDQLVKDVRRISAICHCTGKISGVVTDIFDGNTFKLHHECYGLSALNEAKVRLAGIHAPEHPDQPFSVESKEYLMDLIYGENVVVEAFRLDQHDRVLGMVYLLPSSKNINLDMIRHGYACVYDGRGAEYGKFYKDFKRLEAKAKRLKRGMWSHTDTVLPGEYKAKELGKP